MNYIKKFMEDNGIEYGKPFKVFNMTAVFRKNGEDLYLVVMDKKKVHPYNFSRIHPLFVKLLSGKYFVSKRNE